MNGVEPTAGDGKRYRRTKARPLVWGMVAGASGAAITVLLVLYFVARGTLPLVTDDALAEARERWEQRGPKHYRLQLNVSGSRAGTVMVEVRDGEAINLLRDGRTPPRHTWDFWTVTGQFEAIEMERTGDPQAMFGVPNRADVILRADFDSELGYPRQYQRTVLGKSLEIGWQVVRFENLE